MSSCSSQRGCKDRQDARPSALKPTAGRLRTERVAPQQEQQAAAPNNNPTHPTPGSPSRHAWCSRPHWPAPARVHRLPPPPRQPPPPLLPLPPPQPPTPPWHCTTASWTAAPAPGSAAPAGGSTRGGHSTAQLAAERLAPKPATLLHRPPPLQRGTPLTSKRRTCSSSGFWMVVSLARLPWAMRTSAVTCRGGQPGCRKIRFDQGATATRVEGSAALPPSAARSRCGRHQRPLRPARPPTMRSKRLAPSRSQS